MARYNHLAARVRLLERSGSAPTSAPLAPPGPTVAEAVIASAAEIHGILDERLGKHFHSLSVAARAACQSGLMPDHLARRVQRLAGSANCLRHTTAWAARAVAEEVHLSCATPAVPRQLQSSRCGQLVVATDP